MLTNPIIENMVTRRSCKNYKPDPVPQEVIDTVIEAGLHAANGIGKQSPILIAVTEKKTRDSLSDLNTKYMPLRPGDPFYGAPVVICVLADKSVPTYVCDGSLVIGNMMLAAKSLGFGGCWIHRAKEMFDDEEGKAILADLGIKGDYEGVGNFVMGYPAADLGPARPIKDNRVFYLNAPTAYASH